jgi:hypothetical protein
MLARDCPAELRPRMLSLLSKASRHAGFLAFDLNDFASAQYYYEDARTLAHEAGDVELGVFVLCSMSYLATWQRKPRMGIDHAVAAGEWAKRTDSVRLQAYATDMAAQAYAADGQPELCLAALDAADTALATTGGHNWITSTSMTRGYTPRCAVRVILNCTSPSALLPVPSSHSRPLASHTLEMWLS